MNEQLSLGAETSEDEPPDGEESSDGRRKLARPREHLEDIQVGEPAAEPDGDGGNAAKCGKTVLRLSRLDNGAEIAKNGTDELFPEAQSSIAKESVKCGDTAAGISEPCSKYNHWDSFPKIMEKEEKEAQKMKEEKVLVDQCIKFS